jgi:hypothetical protein
MNCLCLIFKPLIRSCSLPGVKIRRRQLLAMSIIFGRGFTRRNAFAFVSIKNLMSTGSSHGKADLTAQDPLFRYTSGRWLYNEELQLKRRYVKFNVAALRDIAGHALGVPFSRVTKLPEGLYNKVFLLGSDTGEGVLARIPNPNAGSSRCVVASEVATLTL